MILKRNKKKEVLFFYDKFKGSGNGHQLRCQYLSQLFPKTFKLKFVNSKKKVFLKKKYEFGIIDSYIINYQKEKKLKKICKKLVTIDDFSKRKFASDIIINYSPLAKKKFYKRKILNTKLFLGSKFNFVLNFTKFEKKRVKHKVKILVYLGTKKRSHIMNSLTEEIKKRKIFNEIFIFGNGKKITSHKKFLKKMRFSDILILSSGVTLQEGISQRKMIFATFVSQNQKSFYDYYKKRGLIKDIKYFKRFIKFSDSKIFKLIKDNKKKFVRLSNNNLSKNNFWRKLNA